MAEIKAVKIHSQVTVYWLTVWCCYKCCTVGTRTSTKCKMIQCAGSSAILELVN